MDSDLKIAQELLIAACRALHLQENVRVLAIKGNRWILDDVQQDQNKPNFVRAIFDIEDHIFDEIKAPIDIIFESLEDKNKRDIKTGRTPQKFVTARGIESLDD